MFTSWLATIVAIVLLLLAVVHAYWAAAGQRGASAAVPTRPDGPVAGAPIFRPGRLATLAVAVALGLAAILVLGRAGLLPGVGPVWAYRYGAWAIGTVFLLRTVGDFRYVGMFKRVRATRFAVLDTRLYTPLCAVLAAAMLYLATR